MSPSAWRKRRARLQRSPWGRPLLRLLALGYGAGVAARGWLYDLGVLRRRAVAARVVCIGNLTTGGTGKTPAAILAALTLRRRDHPVAILTRGYGRPEARRGVQVLNDDSELTWRQCGDEPWMMHQALKGQGVPILISPDRVEAAEAAVTFFSSRVLILDDGFQHRALKRDLDVVLVNAADPFGGGELLPLGNLREPVRALRRAHLILLTHVDRVSEPRLHALREEIRRLCPKTPLLESLHRPDFLFDAKAERRLSLDSLDGRRVGSLAGLGDPAQFEAALAAKGMVLAQTWRYPDHHRYSGRELRSMDHLLAGLPLVTTFKDLVRFPSDWRRTFSGEIFVLAIKLDIVKGKNAWIDALIDLAAKRP
ncbi:MAG: tetraacyldisaccharide 4'-kinase [Elusimicrobia bacterium]|nr:tetraacyldisaccharide 4'-kinase [Elusimicrobiota bacterium]